MGAVMMADQLKGLKKIFDYSEYGGAPILGVRGPVIKIHGSSNAKAVTNAIIKGVPYVEHGRSRKNNKQGCGGAKRK